MNTKPHRALFFRSRFETLTPAQFWNTRERGGLNRLPIWGSGIPAALTGGRWAASEARFTVAVVGRGEEYTSSGRGVAVGRAPVPGCRPAPLANPMRGRFP